jgi:carbon storage regulator
VGDGEVTTLPISSLGKERQMLILTRKVDQGIVIQGNILVRVLGVERDRVKIGIAAPVEITVLRQELLGPDADASSPAQDGERPKGQQSAGEQGEPEASPDPRSAKDP